MKVKIKGTDNIKIITPDEWGALEKTGQSEEYDIVERNTVVAAPIDNRGELVMAQKREFEQEHWHKLLNLGSKNKWKRVDN